MLLINCKAELKIKRANHCVLLGNDNDNDYANFNNNNIFTMKGTKLYTPLSLYWQETIKAWQNFLAEDLKDQCIEMNIKQNVRIKIQQMSINIFSNQTWQEQIV